MLCRCPGRFQLCEDPKLIRSTPGSEGVKNVKITIFHVKVEKKVRNALQLPDLRVLEWNIKWKLSPIRYLTFYSKVH